MARQVPFKFLPQLRFLLDTALDHAQRIETLLRAR
jgi:ribosome-binding factor A